MVIIGFIILSDIDHRGLNRIAADLVVSDNILSYFDAAGHLYPSSSPSMALQHCVSPMEALLLCVFCETQCAV